MAYQISTESCVQQFPLRKRRKPVVSLDELEGPAPSKSRQNYVSCRPDVDGNTPKLTKQKSRPKQHRRKQAREPGVDVLPAHAEDNIAFPSTDQVPNEQSLDLLMSELEEQEKLKPTPWQRRTEELECNWRDHRSFMFTRLVDDEGLKPEMDRKCSSCNKEDIVVKCLDCSNLYLCEVCDNIIHKCCPLHDRIIWDDDGMRSFAATDFPLPINIDHVDFNCASAECKSVEWHSKNKGKFIVVTTKGRFDVPRQVRACGKCGREEAVGLELANLLQGGFWPATPNISSIYVYEQKLLDLWHHVYRQMPGSAVSGFLRSLCDISGKFGREPIINQTLFSRVASEYGYFVDEMAMLKHQDNMKCPPCSIAQHTSHVDGNHKLYRYDSVRRGSKEDYFKGRFIADDKDVKQHILQVYPERPLHGQSSYTDMYCGQSKWKAARETSARHEKLDETGLVVSGCRHAVMQKAVNMFAGELYGYAHYLHINFLLPNNVKYMFQDVMCKYWLWAKKIGLINNQWQSAVKTVKPALSVFHAKAHAWYCQVRWGGRYVDGVGGGSGEDMEQAFSHLSRIGVTTKHMNAATRADTITDHVLYWNRRKIKGLPKLLSRRYKQLQTSMNDTQNDLRELCASMNVTMKDVDTWTKEVEAEARAVDKTIKSKTTDTLLERYYVMGQQLQTATALQTFVSASSEGLSAILGQHELYSMAKAAVSGTGAVGSEVKRLKTTLQEELPSKDIDSLAKEKTVQFACQRLQAEIELTHRAIRQRDEAVKDIAVTSKQRSSFRRRNEKEKVRIKSALQQLHQVQKILDADAPVYNFDDIMKGTFPWHVTAKADWATKRRGADLYKLQQRLAEEKPLLVGEMENYLRYLINVRKTLQSEIKVLVKDLAEQEQKISHPLTSAEDLGSNESLTEEGATSSKYQIDHSTKTTYTIRGLIAIKQQGVIEAEENIKNGMKFFKCRSDGNTTLGMLIDSIEEDLLESLG